MSDRDLSQEEAELLIEAVRRGFVRVTLYTRTTPMPGGAARLALAEGLVEGGFLGRSGMRGDRASSTSDETYEFHPTAKGRARAAAGG